MCIIWVIQLIVGYFVYRDAKERDVNPVLWFVLVIIPMIGWLFLVIYLIIRETGPPGLEVEKKSARAILDERFAQGRSPQMNTNASESNLDNFELKILQHL